MTPPDDYQSDSVGKALPGMELKLEEDGELCIQGPYVAEGYFKDDDSKVFVNGLFHTEDIFEEKKSNHDHKIQCLIYNDLINNYTFF